MLSRRRTSPRSVQHRQQPAPPDVKHASCTRTTTYIQAADSSLDVATLRLKSSHRALLHACRQSAHGTSPQTAPLAALS